MKRLFRSLLPARQPRAAAPPARPAPALTLPPPRPGDAAISVVVPLFNHAGYVAQALRSALAQTAPPLDVVVIDDGSTDDGRQIAATMLRDNPGCTVLTQPNSGAHAAINRAVALCRGDYVAVLNSDDVFLPDKLERVQALLAAAPDTGLIAGRAALIDSRGVAQTSGVAADWLARAHAFADTSGMPRLALLNENHVATTSNMVFSRRLWDALGGFAALRYCHDLEFLLRAFDHGRVLLDRAHEHIQYRVHPGNTIGEDGFYVRVEIAAVVAATLHDSGGTLLNDDSGAPPRTIADGLDALQTVLRNKNLSDLTLYFVALRHRFPSRAAFFAHVTGEPHRTRYADLLRARGS